MKSNVEIAPTDCPILVNSTDTPITPCETHMAIFYYALMRLSVDSRA